MIIIMSSSCAHEDHIPVETVGSPTYGQETAPIIAVVARLCLSCSTQLPVSWGCTDCTWVDGPRRLCDPSPSRVLAHACPTHEGH